MKHEDNEKVSEKASEPLEYATNNSNIEPNELGRYGINKNQTENVENQENESQEVECANENKHETVVKSTRKQKILDWTKSIKSRVVKTFSSLFRKSRK